jgi:radical SAM protein with 4Fe4S-binding SPASM domain
MQTTAIPFRSMRVKPEERSVLVDEIPLSTPYQLVIDSTNACNFKCEFCPTGDPELIKKSGRPFGNMPLELFKKIVDDATKFPKRIKRIDFGKDGEPFVNKHLAEMVQYAKQKQIADMVAVTTNGSLLTRKNIDQILDSGVDMIKVSVEAVSDAGYLKIARVKFDYRELVESVRYLYERRGACKVGTKIIDFGLSEEEKIQFFNDFNEISDFINVDQPSDWNNKSERDFTLGYAPKGYLDLPVFSKKEVCPVPFYSLSICFNGDVSICCVDWAHDTVVGNLSTESIVDLWNGESLFNFRKMHLTHNRKDNKSCANCFSINGWIDNIDPHADEILQRLSALRK